MAVPEGDDAAGSGRHTSTRRRELIRDRVLAGGTVRIDELASSFGVTVMTIHRDLNVLEAQGWLRKVRGGAVVDSSASIDTSARHRLTAMVEQKRAIARCALEQIGTADSVMIDDSTTVLALTELFGGGRPLTVITNFLMAINDLVDRPGVELIALGGTYDSTYQAFHGLHVREAISRLRADVLFMSTTAILDDSLYHKSQETILIRHAMMASAARRVLLVDHTKFHRRAVHQFANLSDFDAVIVDAGLDASDATAMRERGVPLIVAEPGAGQGGGPGPVLGHRPAPALSSTD